MRKERKNVYTGWVRPVHSVSTCAGAMEQPEDVKSQRFRALCESHVRWSMTGSGSGAMSGRPRRKEVVNGLLGIPDKTEGGTRQDGTSRLFYGPF